MARSQDIAEAFTLWEERLRGWDVYPYTIDLEPPLIPLVAYLAPSTQTFDDGKEETLLSDLSNTISNLLKPKQTIKTHNNEPEYDYSDEPALFTIPDEKLCTLQLALPTDHTASLITYKNLLQSLRYASQYLSFEIVGSSDQIAVQLCAWQSDAEKLLQQIRAHLPAATVTENPDVIDPHIFSAKTLIVDFGLEHEVMCPLQKITDLKHDPLTALVGGMEALSGKRAVYSSIII